LTENTGTSEYGWHFSQRAICSSILMTNCWESCSKKPQSEIVSHGENAEGILSQCSAVNRGNY
jgi:hypothetical protein